jgi:hypothetical protein
MDKGQVGLKFNILRICRLNIWVSKYKLHERSNVFFSMARQPLGGLGRLIGRFFTITLWDTPHSVGFPCKRDQPIAETSTWQHTTLTRDMPSVGFESTIPVSERLQTYALDRAATGIGVQMYRSLIISISTKTITCIIYLAAVYLTTLSLAK